MINRREFIKKLAVGGAAASMLGQIGTGPDFFGVREARASERNRLVFLSDLHLGAVAAYAPLSEHVVDLASFLERLNDRTDVAELVLLGDIFDDWVFPTEDTPLAFADILDAPQNASVIAALQDICNNPNIQTTYVTGNHDLLSWQEENRLAIAQTFPQMTILSDAPGLGAYSKDGVIWAEHGHRYCLFNAPDIWSHQGSHLPLGYFITRLASSKSVTDHRMYHPSDVLNALLKETAASLNRSRKGLPPYWAGPDTEGIVDDALIVALFNAMAFWAGKRPRDRFILNGKDGFQRNPMVERVAFLYDTIFSQWPERQNIVTRLIAVTNDLEKMYATAELLLTMPERIRPLYPFTPRIVLFGHTHQPCLFYHAHGKGTVYANTGTWVDDKPMTWVEIEVTEPSPSQRSYRIELWYNDEAQPRQFATIVVDNGGGSIPTGSR